MTKLKYTVYFLVLTFWYILLLLATDGVYWKILTIIGYIIALIVYFLYYIPIDKAYTKAFK